MDKNYIIFNDGRVGYIKGICTCEKCKDRNQAEMFINGLDGIYMDCIKINEVEDIFYIGNSLSEGIKNLTEYYQKLINTEKLGKEKQCQDILLN